MESKITAVVIMGFLAFALVSKGYADVAERRGPDLPSTAAPVLLYPVTDHIDLKGARFLEFKWERVYDSTTNHFEFKLYKGYNTLKADQVYGKDYYSGEYPVQVPADLLKTDQAYTWVLVQVYNSGRKSDPASSSFKIIHK